MQILHIAGAHAAEIMDLDSLEWSNRIILVHHQNMEVDKLEQRLNQAHELIEERHIYWFIFKDKKVLTNYPGRLAQVFHSTLVSKWFGNQTAPTEVVLIGKDGTEKWRGNRLDLDVIFSLIDQMPMRRQEMIEQR
jgi:hypothetical protein